MSDSLRILHYNTQLRSWGMEAGADEAIPPSETAEERANLIAGNVLASRHDYDVLCFNEVFDEDARWILAAELASQYPYAITKSDVGAVEVAWPLKPPLHINPLALALSVTGPGFLAGWLTLGHVKVEDSGLMLFSRWPFALRPLDETLVGLLDPLTASELTPLGLPQVAFRGYDDSDGNDAWAAKGVVYARIERAGGRTYHLFASHTQADSDSTGEHKGVRVQQLADVWDFIQLCVGSGPPLPDEIFFLGDLNIVGGQANLIPLAAQEWDSHASTPGSPFTDDLIDVWGREQCTGAPGLRDPGTTAPAVYPPHEQRLDYLFRSAAGSLAVQHLYIDHEVASVPPGIDGVSYLSDHLPLGADLNERRPFCTPDTAMAAAATPNFTHNNWAPPGGVQWFRFDQNGTYEFRVDSDFDVRLEVYLDTDLSRPRQPYRMESNPDVGTKFVLPTAPFLVKVFCADRHTEFNYEFRAHRHQGRSPWDAIDIVPGIQYPEGFPASQILNLDLSFTPWDDTDTKWFRLQTPQTAISGEIELSVEVTLGDHADTGAMLWVGREESGGTVDQIANDGPSAGPLTAAWTARSDETFFVVVQRNDTGGVPLTFDVTADTNVSILLGGRQGLPRLCCREETSGWGSDDIALRISSDGSLLRAISNDEIGDFDDEDIRDLDQWIPVPVPYVDGIEVTVIEEDDIDPDDVGTVRIPNHAALPTTSGIRIDQTDPDGTMRISADIGVDDGTYEFRATVARWNEQA